MNVVVTGRQPALVVKVGFRGPRGEIDPQDRARFDQAVEVSETIEAVVDDVEAARIVAEQAAASATGAAAQAVPAAATATTQASAAASAAAEAQAAAAAVPAQVADVRNAPTSTTLKLLAQNQWMDAEWSGTEWRLVGFGSL